MRKNKKRAMKILVASNIFFPYLGDMIQFDYPLVVPNIAREYSPDVQ